MAGGSGFKKNLVKAVTVNLQLKEAHHQLREQVERAILVVDETRNNSGNINVVRQELVARFGDTMAHYPEWKISADSYVIRLLVNVEINRVVNGLSIWGMQNHWLILHFDPDRGSKARCEKYMVRIRIKNLPLECWHEEYILEIISPLSTCQEIDYENLYGVDRRYLNVWISCDDPREIPKYITVKYGKRMRICTVIVIDWYFDTWVPMGVRNGDWDDSDRYSSSDEDQEDRENKFVRKRLIVGRDRLNQQFKSLQSSSTSSSRLLDENEQAVRGQTWDQKWCAPKEMSQVTHGSCTPSVFGKNSQGSIIGYKSVENSFHEKECEQNT